MLVVFNSWFLQEFHLIEGKIGHCEQVSNDVDPIEGRSHYSLSDNQMFDVKHDHA
jgi:hypothetical protein